MRRSLAALLSVASLITLEFGSVVLLHRLGSTEMMQIDWTNFGRWLDTSSPENVSAAIARLAALALAYYLLVMTALYVLATVTRIPGAVRAVEWATVPALRRTLDRVLIVSLATSSVVGGTATTAFAADNTGDQGRTPVVSMANDDEGMATPQATGGISTPSAETSTTAIPSTEFLFGTGDSGGSAATATPTPTTEAPSTTAGPTTPSTQPIDLGALFPGAGPTTTDAPATTAAPTTKAPTTKAPTTKAPTKTTAAEKSDEGGMSTPATTAAKKEAAPEKAATPTPAPATQAPQVLGEQQYAVQDGDSLWNIAEQQLANAGGDTSDAAVRDYWVKVVEANQGNLRSGNPDVIYAGESITLPSI